MHTLYLGDCLIESEKIKPGSVDLILTDPPYGNMNTDGGRKLNIHKWDIPIQPKEIFDMANRILRKNGKLILFSQEPYTSELIKQAIPNIPFSYRMIWEKDNFANALGVNKNPVSFFEDILVYSKQNPKYDFEKRHPLRKYFTEEKEKSRLSDTDIKKILGNSMGSHYFTNGDQFRIPTLNNYKKLQSTGFFKLPWEDMKKIDSEYRINLRNKINTENPSVFNLWEGGKFKSNILRYKKDYDGYHPTQKPILLLEDLIKTFSNDYDTVVDLTMGSGSTGVACVNTNRNFIGIEKDEKYYGIAKDRIQKEILNDLY